MPKVAITQESMLREAIIQKTAKLLYTTPMGLGFHGPS